MYHHFKRKREKHDCVCFRKTHLKKDKNAPNEKSLDGKSMYEFGMIGHYVGVLNDKDDIEKEKKNPKIKWNKPLKMILHRIQNPHHECCRDPSKY
jgi:hypothetical protein